MRKRDHREVIFCGLVDSKIVLFCSTPSIYILCKLCNVCELNKCIDND